MERPVRYIRKPIDYTLLDDVGHGVKVSRFFLFCVYVALIFCSHIIFPSAQSISFPIFFLSLPPLCFLARGTPISLCLLSHFVCFSRSNGVSCAFSFIFRKHPSLTLQEYVAVCASGNWFGRVEMEINLKKKQLRHVAFRKQLCSWIVVIRDTFVGLFFFFFSFFFKGTLAALIISLWRWCYGSICSLSNFSVKGSKEAFWCDKLFKTETHPQLPAIRARSRGCSVTSFPDSCRQFFYLFIFLEISILPHERPLRHQSANQSQLSDRLD